jgi:hypothetical protein
MGFELTTLVVIGTDCMGSYKSNYHTYMIMTTTATFSKNVVVMAIKDISISVTIIFGWGACC